MSESVNYWDDTDNSHLQVIQERFGDDAASNQSGMLKNRVSFGSAKKNNLL